MAVDIRSLKCFLAVCASGSISKAADLMHIAQPAMSLQMKNLEEQLGVQLLDRAHHGISLTRAGERLLSHATVLVAQFEAALDDVRRLASRPAGPVRVGLPQSMAKLLTVALVAQTVQRWPDIGLTVAELSTGYIPEQILKGNIDIGLTFESNLNSGLIFEKIAEESLVVVAPPGTFSANGTEKVPLKSLEHRPMIFPSKEHGLRSLLDRQIAASGCHIQPIAEVNAIHQLVDLVSNGVGCTLLSHAAVAGDLKMGRVCIAELVQPNIARPIFIVQRALAVSSTARSCVHVLLKDIIAALIDDGAWAATRCMPNDHAVKTP